VRIVRVCLAMPSTERLRRARGGSLGGQVGTCTAQDPATGRCEVQLHGEDTQIRISGDNLKLEEEPRAGGPSRVGPPASERAQAGPPALQHAATRADERMVGRTGSRGAA